MYVLANDFSSDWELISRCHRWYFAEKVHVTSPFLRFPTFQGRVPLELERNTMSSRATPTPITAVVIASRTIAQFPHGVKAKKWDFGKEAKHLPSRGFRKNHDSCVILESRLKRCIRSRDRHEWTARQLERRHFRRTNEANTSTTLRHEDTRIWNNLCLTLDVLELKSLWYNLSAILRNDSMILHSWQKELVLDIPQQKKR